MTRKRKSRKPGSEGEEQYVAPGLSQQQQDGRERQKARKHKGLKSGARNSSLVQKQQQIHSSKDNNPRLGSKKPILLVVEKTTKPAQSTLNLEKELKMLEDDAQLHALLDRLDNGEKLGSGLQTYVDEKLDRIAFLMDRLGLLDDE